MAVEIKSFQQKLTEGQAGESLIARYLRRRGWKILPVYEKELDTGKGPRIFLSDDCPEGELIFPDLLGKKDSQVRFYEAKSKSTATFYRKKMRWQTGIDKNQYENYKRVQDSMGWPVWLLFLQFDGADNNAPAGAPPCPSGLFYCPLDQPYSDEGFYWRNGKQYPMIYWAISDLRRIATLAEVFAAS